MGNARVVVVLITVSLGGPARAGVSVNELLGSTEAEDAEFIELFNPGREAVDLSGWTIDLWDSDAGPTHGTRDAGTPIRLGGTIDGGGYFLIANTRFSAFWDVEPDMRMRDNGIENSSYTLVLKDGLGTIVETIFVTDGGEGDSANIGGREITPDAVIGSGNGGFIPAGFARMDAGPAGDAESRVYRLLEFSPMPAPSATPGEPNAVVEGDD